MAYYEGHSQYQTDCIYFNWKYVNYDKIFPYDSMYSGGNRMYAPDCGKEECAQMFFRPIANPCEGCPYYEKGEERGGEPPGGYNV